MKTQNETRIRCAVFARCLVLKWIGLDNLDQFCLSILTLIQKHYDFYVFAGSNVCVCVRVYGVCVINVSINRLNLKQNQNDNNFVSTQTCQ